MRNAEQNKALSLTDLIAAYRLDSIRALKRYSLLSAAVAIAIASLAAGMPGHFLWRWLGIPLVLSFVYTFALSLFHAGRLLWDWLEKLGK